LCKQCLLRNADSRNAWCPFKKCECSRQVPAESLIRLAQKFGVNIPSFAGKGRLDHITPAMAASLHGHLNTSVALMEEDFREDGDHDSLLYSSARHPVFLIAAIMLVIWIVGILVPVCSGEDMRVDTQVRIIIAKGAILLTINCMMKYLHSLLQMMVQASGRVQATSFMAGTPWAQTVQGAMTMLGILLVGTVAFMCYDLRKAKCPPVQDTDQEARIKVPLRDMYQDLDTKFVRCMQRFALTLVFLLCYLTVCAKAQEPTLRSLTFWYLSLLVQIHFAESCSKSASDKKTCFCDLPRWACCADLPHEPELWKLLFQNQTVTVINEDADNTHDKEVKVSCGTFELTCRFILSYISNGFIRVIVLYTLPIFLAATTDEKDFALNAFAVTFIVELDNLSSNKKVEARGYRQLKAEESEGEALTQGKCEQ